MNEWTDPIMSRVNDAGTPIGKHEHGGNIHKLETGEADNSLIDFSANINPLGPPAWLRSSINRNLHLISHYPDPDCVAFIDAISERYRVDRDFVVPANGTTELLHLIPRIVTVTRVLVPVPCYIDYIGVFQKNGFDIIYLEPMRGDDFSVSLDQIEAELEGNEIVIFGNPVNPSGTVTDDNDIVNLAEKHPETLFVIDEAFHDFIAPFATVGGRLDNIITLNSLTKFYGIPGLRVGFGIFPPPYLQRIKTLLPQWSVNTLAQIVGTRALQDESYCTETRYQCARLRTQLKDAITSINRIKVFDSQANYLLLKLGSDLSAESLYRDLLQEGIIVRRCGNYRALGDSYIRVAVRSEKENRRLVGALTRVLAPLKRSGNKKVGAATIMFQGTSSNAGKSIMSAAFCRILYQDGYKVCPFKAQNMSLNSHVTVDGGEMGRAQVVQAQAAKIEPDWRMNPVLLKPNSDTGSQVIVNGKPVRNMDVRQYHAYKDEAWKAVIASFDELRDNYDVIVMEGAGSPGEVNLKSHDIVNMKMARYAEAPVLLVGDIDRGGVYASFAGIMDVLEEWERELIVGFIVNKFRGDESLLDDAHRFIREHTGRDVFGVIPYIRDMSIPQEDSVSLREGFYRDRGTGLDQVEIVVVDIPHISNFTDIDPLYFEPDVNIRFVSDPRLIGRPDCIILPGSKNVVGDLRYLMERGFDAAIVECHKNGAEVVGVCGGYQMLGNLIRDPHQIETTDGAISGIGLLGVDTVMARDKTLTKRNGTHIESGRKIVGYEIHHGKTDGSLMPVLKFENGVTCGCRNRDGSVWGAYLHGIFDEDFFRRWFIDRLRGAKNLEPLGEDGGTYNVDKSLDELADLVRSNLDVARIYRLLNLES